MITGLGRGGGASRRIVMKISLTHKFEDIISVDNLLLAWKEFCRDKKYKPDVSQFSLNLMKNIFSLHSDLANHTYVHGGYQAFKIADPKPRDIHKATVRDRLLHHAIYRILYPYFDKKFIADSYSCRLDKGTHKALQRFGSFTSKSSRNNTKTCWVLKCDVKKFFASIDHEILMQILRKHIQDEDIVWLIGQVVASFHSTEKGKGLPLGNLTSQLLVNIYLNEFDQFMKHNLKAKHYIRYADDFVILSQDKKYLAELLTKINEFLNNKLKLTLHPNKVSIGTLASGIDFLGWVHFSNHRILRTATKRRMLRAMAGEPKPETVASYRGMLGWGNAERLKTK